MFETLLYLVRVHAQVNAAAETLLDRTLCTLVDALAEDALQAFRMIDRFGMGGMLRVRGRDRIKISHLLARI
jgi:exocyst complex component 2